MTYLKKARCASELAHGLIAFGLLIFSSQTFARCLEEGWPSEVEYRSSGAAGQHELVLGPELNGIRFAEIDRFQVSGNNIDVRFEAGDVCNVFITPYPSKVFVPAPAIAPGDYVLSVTIYRTGEPTFTRTGLPLQVVGSAYGIPSLGVYGCLLLVAMTFVVYFLRQRKWARC